MKASALEADKITTSFTLENEISKLKIPIPLVELLKYNDYRENILKLLQPFSSIDLASDILKLHDEKPTIMLGPIVEERDDTTPPLYISQKSHNNILHILLLG